MERRRLKEENDSLAEMKKEIIKEEVDRLSSMDEIKCRILGLGEDEALNG